MYTSAFLDLPPFARAGGTVLLPGSKSISNRVLLLAALSSGTTVIEDLLVADDTAVMRVALQKLGCTVEARGAELHVAGLGGRLITREAALDLGNAGTAMRPLTAALAILAAQDGGTFELGGVARMHERPIGDLVDALRQLGCQIDYLGEPGFPPLRVRRQVRGASDTRPGNAAPTQAHGATLVPASPIRVRGDVSSQFLTALLLALPLISARAGAPTRTDTVAAHETPAVIAATDAPTPGIVIEVDGELISRPYVEITLNLMARFGVLVKREGWRRFTVASGSRYSSPGRIRVEGDASSASYFLAAGAIAGCREPVRIVGVGLDSIQGDIRFVDAARAMGADIRGGLGWLESRRGRFPLQAITLDCSDIPDAAMTLAAMALFAEGTTFLTHIGSWRVKETDRIAAMASELRKCGATVVETADSLAITAPATWHAAAIETYDDHRMAMCLALAACNGAIHPPRPRSGASKVGLKAASQLSPVEPIGDSANGAGAVMVAAPSVPVRILQPRCVGKTFPDFFETLFQLVDGVPGSVPVITIDGPSASGKGTLASSVAVALGYHLLDSGSLYRATAWAALQAGIAADDEPALALAATRLDLRFNGDQVTIGGLEVTDALRQEEVGALASRISALPTVRQALLNLQLAFRRVPGLVADGRDMGTVIFPSAGLKIFLTASAERRAERRWLQLRAKGISANIDSLRADLELRDARDRNRSVSPSVPAEDAVLLDNSALSIEASVEVVLEAWEHRRPFG